MVKKKKMTLRQMLKKENKAFNKLSAPKKRVALAKDVIIQLGIKNFKAYPGVYVFPRVTDIGILQNIDTNNNIQQANLLVSQGVISCEVCAKGAIFMSHVMKTNSCSVKEVKYSNSNEPVTDRVSEFFDRDQLNLIEAAFEENPDMYTEDAIDDLDDGDDIIWDLPDPKEIRKIEKLANKAVKFGDKYKTPHNRLIAIMKNIIKNKGTFKP